VCGNTQIIRYGVAQDGRLGRQVAEHIGGSGASISWAILYGQ
jgi:hypothetical protein